MAVTFKVRFTNVGRANMSWEADLSSRSESAMVREIRRKGALASRGIDFAEGVIYVGGFRAVGMYEFVDPAPAGGRREGGQVDALRIMRGHGEGVRIR